MENISMISAYMDIASYFEYRSKTYLVEQLLNGVVLSGIHLFPTLEHQI